MAIQRIKERQETHKLGRLRLYRDDLEAMARALMEFGDLKVMVNDEVMATEPEDLADLRDHLPEQFDRVELQATKEFNGGRSTVYVDLGTGAKVLLVEPDMAARGVFNSVKEICAPRRVSAPWSGVGLVLMLVALVGTIALGLAGAEPQGWPMLTTMGLLGVSVVITFWASRAPEPSGDIILNVPRAERPTFGQRLFADGGVSAFWTVVGLVCGGFISWVVNQLPGL